MSEETSSPRALPRKRVILIGGGMSGLAIAFELLDAERRGDTPPLELLLLEAGSRTGGNVRTERDSGYVGEWGPEGFLDNVPETLALARRIGLESRLTQARPQANRRYILRRGRLRRLPMSPPAFLASDILPLLGRLRVLGEFLVPGKKDDADESVFDFAARRIGEKAAATLVDAMVSGVYAGDARRLSLPSAFPRMREMERKHGSLIRAMISGARGGTVSGGPSGPKGILTSFDTGMEAFIEGLASAIGRERIRLDSPVERLEQSPDGGWRVLLRTGESLVADAIVVSTPAHAAHALMAGVSPALSTPLGRIPYAGIVVVVWGWDVDRIARPLDGFGFLIPRDERLKTLGALWTSATFEGRAPHGKALIRLMVGGATFPDALALSDPHMRSLCLGEVGPVMGLSGGPSWERIIRFPRGIAQYNVGHGALLSGIEDALHSLPGLFLAGTAYKGIAINHACAAAAKAAASVLQFLRSGAAAGQLF